MQIIQSETEAYNLKTKLKLSDSTGDKSPLSKPEVEKQDPINYLKWKPKTEDSEFVLGF